MKNRCIAVLLLASLIGWSMPVAFASPAKPLPQAAQESVRHSDSSGHSHACCPGAHSLLDPVLLVNAEPAAMPCGDEHPCCAKSGPHNPPTLPGTTKIARPDSEGSLATISEHCRAGRTRITAETSVNVFPSYFERSTVLRI